MLLWSFAHHSRSFLGALLAAPELVNSNPTLTLTLTLTLTPTLHPHPDPLPHPHPHPKQADVLMAVCFCVLSWAREG